jgi:ribosomal protein S18 acetylase RimI-like enzyme
MDIRALGPGDDDAVVAAQHLFDGPADAAATARFLADPGHHLLIAHDGDGRPVGFVSGVEVIQPDKGTELLLYELGVDESARRQGYGRALVLALGALARARGCSAAFVFVDDDNEPALATYRSAGARRASQPVMLEWDL